MYSQIGVYTCHIVQYDITVRKQRTANKRKMKEQGTPLVKRSILSTEEISPDTVAEQTIAK